MKQSSFEEIGAVLRSNETFAVLSHVRPDGDALGSQLGLALSLSKLGKKVVVRNEDGLLEKYNFLPGGEFLQTPLGEPQDFDVAIALDTAVENRLGNAAELVRSAKTWINIDHHPSNPRYGDLVYIDPTAPATGQILFEFLTNQKFPVTPAIAENLYAAISTTSCSWLCAKSRSAVTNPSNNFPKTFAAIWKRAQSSPAKTRPVIAPENSSGETRSRSPPPL